MGVLRLACKQRLEGRRKVLPTVWRVAPAWEVAARRRQGVLRTSTYELWHKAGTNDVKFNVWSWQGTCGCYLALKFQAAL